MSATHCRVKGSAVLAAICILGPFWPSANLRAQPDDIHEVGGSPPAPTADIKMPRLSLPGTQVEFAFQYVDLGNSDMQETYGGLPQIAVGLSAQATTDTRTYFSLGYGRGSGDPYHSRTGFSDPDGVTVAFIPLQIGLRIDAAANERIHANFTAALELAWIRETIPAQLGAGQFSASGVNGGFHFAFGPEWVFAENQKSLGLEIGWGGAKGEIHDGSHRHDVDLTGLRAKLFFTHKL